MNKVHDKSLNIACDYLVSDLLSVDNTLPKGIVIGYSERSTNALVALQGASAQEVLAFGTSFPQNRGWFEMASKRKKNEVMKREKKKKEYNERRVVNWQRRTGIITFTC